MKFYLGTHKPGWLARLEVPLFVSHRRLDERATLPRARTSWALDSGGFSELSMFGEWRTKPWAYVIAVRRYRDEIGKLAWAAPQDWMVEDVMLRRTGLNVAEHQWRTIANYLDLRALDADLPFVPVIQGQTVDDYRRHVDLYEANGVALAELDLVGIGSVCRRQRTTEIVDLIGNLTADGLRLHGFGVKASGLRQVGSWLASADSMAWSYDARRSPPLPGCPHRSCSNCPLWALRWRERTLSRIESVPAQLSLAVDNADNSGYCDDVTTNPGARE